MPKKNKPIPAGLRPRKQLSIRLDEETIEYLEREALMLAASPPFLDISVSDVIRYAIRKYREDHAPAKAVMRRPCDIIETTGGTFCTKCSSRGPIGQDPECRHNGK